jgi:hypothetical protein
LDRFGDEVELVLGFVCVNCVRREGDSDYSYGRRRPMRTASANPEIALEPVRATRLDHAAKEQFGVANPMPNQ